MKQNMVQMLNLIVGLPGIIARSVPRYDEKWKTFLRLREITVILMAEEIHPNALPYLRELIAEFLSMYKANFEANLTAKFHLLTHYPFIIEQIGPIRHFMALRLEGKHRILKKLAITSNNFKNVCFTLSKRHQISFAYRCLSKRGLLCETIEHSGKSVIKSVQDIGIRRLKHYFPVVSTEVLVTNKVSLNGVEFASGRVIYLGMPKGSGKDTFPCFFQIKSIILHDTLVYFVGYAIRVVKFDRHLQAYIVNVRRTYLLEIRERHLMQSPWCFYLRKEKNTDRNFIALPSDLL